jgi:mandelate racemase
MRCAAIAGAAGLPLPSHLYPEVSSHLLRVSETADPFLAAPFQVQDGTSPCPTGRATASSGTKRR